MMDEEALRFSAGEFYMYASNRPHAYRNEGEGILRFVRNVVI